MNSMLASSSFVASSVATIALFISFNTSVISSFLDASSCLGFSEFAFFVMLSSIKNMPPILKRIITTGGWILRKLGLPRTVPCVLFFRMYGKKERADFGQARFWDESISSEIFFYYL